MKTSIATVSLSGSLVEKLHACAAAGFDGVEIFEPDLIASDHSPAEIRALAQRLGLTLDLYQPLRDLEGVDEATFADNLRRAAATFATAQRLGIDTVLVCSNVATATIDSDEVSADQLRRIGDVAQTYGIRIAFEALAWGRYVDDYRRSWRIVELADHPAVGLCLDSFHVLSRGHDPAQIEQIPGEKIFYLQLADAPALSMDVLSWSRHHRLFPGEGMFDLAAFVGHVLAAGYDGPLSLEVFNDTFRQTDPGHTAVHALRSLLWLQDKLGLMAVQDAKPPTGFDFVELKAEDTSEIEVLLGQLGFTPRGRHRTKPVSLWAAGEARVVLNEQQARDQVPHVAAVGLQVPDADATSRRSADLMAPVAFRRTYAAEQPFGAATAPDGTEFFWVTETPGAPAWVKEFESGLSELTPSPIRDIDHVNLTQPWQTAEDAVLFLTSVFGLDTEAPTEVPGPNGLVRSQVLRTADGAIRIPLNVAPHALDEKSLPQHVAFGCTDVIELARSAAAAGLPFLAVPDNYYDYLLGRFGLDEDFVAQLRELNLLYDRSPEGHFVHFYTRTVGTVFFEFVQRFGHYDGYGVDNAPVRLAAQRGGVGTVREVTERRLLLVNGPNLNLLGTRQPEIYGATTLAQIEERAATLAAEFGLTVRAVQSNHEGVLIDQIHAARADCAGIIINPGAYSHTSVAIADALTAVELPVAEVHLSNIHRREPFRHHSYVSAVAETVIAGAGPLGYELAVRYLAGRLAL